MGLCCLLVISGRVPLRTLGLWILSILSGLDFFRSELRLEIVIFQGGFRSQRKGRCVEDCWKVLL
jgi:hypothetical protein